MSGGSRWGRECSNLSGGEGVVPIVSGIRVPTKVGARAEKMSLSSSVKTAGSKSRYLRSLFLAC